MGAYDGSWCTSLLPHPPPHVRSRAAGRGRRGPHHTREGATSPAPLTCLSSQFVSGLLACVAAQILKEEDRESVLPASPQTDLRQIWWSPA